MLTEIPALKFKFDSHALPSSRTDLPLRFAVGESRLNRFDHVAQFFCHHAKQEHDALFVDRFTTQAAEVEGVAIRGTILKLRVLYFLRRNRGRLRRNRGSRVFVHCLHSGLVHWFEKAWFENGWFLDRQKRQDVHPLALALNEITKRLWHSCPAPEMFCQRARIIFSLASIDVPRQYASLSSHRFAPILQQRAVFYSLIQRIRAKSAAFTASLQLLNRCNTKNAEIPDREVNSARVGARPSFFATAATEFTICCLSGMGFKRLDGLLVSMKAENDYSFGLLAPSGRNSDQAGSASLHLRIFPYRTKTKRAAHGRPSCPSPYC